MAEPLVDEARVAAWMDEQDLAPGEPVTITRITTGHSNEVFRSERGGSPCGARGGRHARRCHRPRTTWRASSALTAFTATGWNARTGARTDPIALCTDADVISPSI
jgi:hypothetical protein